MTEHKNEALTSYPDFRQQRLAFFIPYRFYLSLVVLVVAVVVAMTDDHDSDLSFLYTCVAASVTGLIYWLLLRQRQAYLLALLFAPLDFLLITMAVMVNGWAKGGLFIFYMWSVITAGMILHPYGSIAAGVLTAGVAIGSSFQRVADSSMPNTHEFYFAVGVLVVSMATYILIRQLDSSMVEQQKLQAQAEGEQDRLQAEVVKRTAELQLANRNLDNQNVLLALGRRQAEEASYLKTQLLAAMNHEMRTPLTTISGFAELMMRGMHGPVTRRQTERLQQIRSSTQEILRRLRRVSHYATVDADWFEPNYSTFAPAGVVRGVAESLETLLRTKDLPPRIELELVADDFTVTCDEALYRQILENLLSNAIKFTDRGVIVIKLEGDENRFVTEVIDSGVGIEERDLERIFEAFQQFSATPRRSDEGLGIGLYLCRRLATQLQGEIRVESAPGKGSRFTLVLPHHQPLRGAGPEQMAAELGLELNRQQSRAQERQLADAALLRSVVQNSPLPMFLYDEQGSLLLLNPPACTLSNTAELQVRRRPVDQVLYPYEPEIMEEISRRVFRGEICRATWRGHNAEGISIVRVGLHYPILSEHGGRLFAVCVMLEPGNAPLPEGVQQAGLADELRIRNLNPSALETQSGV